MRRLFRIGGSRQAVLLVVAVPLLCATGCRQSEPDLPAGAHAIEMVVLKGTRGETLALVPVYIEGRGPFAFALDTGASRSVVDSRIAAELGLSAAGGEIEVSGVGGRTVARPVRVVSWRVGDIDIPTSTLDALEPSGGDGKTGLQGLLGSDTLSRFQVIRVDYKNGRLVFHPGPSGRLDARP